jgi:hypothetical protein
LRQLHAVNSIFLDADDQSREGVQQCQGIGARFEREERQRLVLAHDRVARCRELGLEGGSHGRDVLPLHRSVRRADHRRVGREGRIETDDDAGGAGGRRLLEQGIGHGAALGGGPGGADDNDEQRQHEDHGEQARFHSFTFAVCRWSLR